MKTYALLRADGNVSIMRLVKGTIQEALAKYHTSSEFRVVDFREIQPDEVPADRTFRNAWAHDGARLFIDMPKARNIWRDRIREARAVAFADLDAQSVRAVEDGDSKKLADIKTRKQVWRDAPADPRIEAAATPEELKALGMPA